MQNERIRFTKQRQNVVSNKQSLKLGGMSTELNLKLFQELLIRDDFSLISVVL